MHNDDEEGVVSSDAVEGFLDEPEDDEAEDIDKPEVAEDQDDRWE